MMTIKTFPVNPLQENCYVVSDDSKECIVIDCGAYYNTETQAIKDYINWYNTDRVCKKLKGLSPINFRKQALNSVSMT